MNDQDITAVLERVVGPLEDEMGSWDDVLRRAAEPRPEGWDDVLHPAGAEHPPRRWTFPRWRVVAVAAVILVGGLLVTPAFGIASSLLDLLKGGGQPPLRLPTVGQVGWSPDGKIVFESRVGTPNKGHYQVYVMNPDGSGKRALLELGDEFFLVSRRADDRILQTAQRQQPGLRHERRRERGTEADVETRERRDVFAECLVARRAEARLYGLEPAGPAPRSTS